MSEKTHYRKAFDSPYLSSADIVDPVILTIKHVRLEKDHTKKTPDYFNTAHFVEREIRRGEKLKPMILNATNSKILAGLTGSKFIDDWNGVPITVYVDSNVRFGKETVEGLRISKAVQRPQAPDELIEQAELAADNGTAFYADWWQATATPAQRKQIGADRHNEFKERAAKADQAGAPAGGEQQEQQQ